MKTRRQARILALQALFEIDCTTHDPGLVLQRQLEARPLSPAGAGFAADLVRGILSHRAELDQVIQEYAPERPIEQLAIVDRNILRIATFELLVDGDTPPKVAINEAVELAKMFGSESSRRFVNGVLGGVMAARSMQIQDVREQAVPSGRG